MASTDFTTRIGFPVAGVELDAVGGDFSAATQLGVPAEEGGTIEVTGDYAKLKDGARMGIRDIIQHSKEIAVECALLDHKAKHLALSFGQPMTDVVDDAVGPPKDESFAIKTAFQGQIYFALRLKIPQPQASTLFDIFTLYRVAPIVAFNQSIQIGAHRFINVRFEATQDSTNSYNLGTVVTEYA
ncbi:MAG: hypothetical protein ACE5I1_11440 [bacterium]